MRQEKMKQAVDGKQLFSFRWPHSSETQRKLVLMKSEAEVIKIKIQLINLVFLIKVC